MLPKLLILYITVVLSACQQAKTQPKEFTHQQLQQDLDHQLSELDQAREQLRLGEQALAELRSEHTMIRAELRESQRRCRDLERAADRTVEGEQDAALEQAVEGDLVVIFGDNIERCWDQVIGHQAEGISEDGKEILNPAQSFVEADPDAFQLDNQSDLIRDERGVRIARVDEQSD